MRRLAFACVGCRSAVNDIPAVRAEIDAILGETERKVLTEPIQAPAGTHWA